MPHSWLLQGQFICFKLPKHEVGVLQDSQSTVSCNPAGEAVQMEVRGCFPVKEGGTLASQWHKPALESFHTDTWSEQGQEFPGNRPHQTQAPVQEWSGEITRHRFGFVQD